MSRRAEPHLEDGVLVCSSGGAACGRYCPNTWLRPWREWHRLHCDACAAARSAAEKALLAGKHDV